MSILLITLTSFPLAFPALEEPRVLLLPYFSFIEKNYSNSLNRSSILPGPYCPPGPPFPEKFPQKDSPKGFKPNPPKPGPPAPAYYCSLLSIPVASYIYLLFSSLNVS